MNISIYTKDGIWAGNGNVNEFGGVECAAVLGPDNEAVYEAIEDAISNGDRFGLDMGYEWEITE